MRLESAKEHRKKKKKKSGSYRPLTVGRAWEAGSAPCRISAMSKSLKYTILYVGSVDWVVVLEATGDVVFCCAAGCTRTCAAQEKKKKKVSENNQ